MIPLPALVENQQPVLGIIFVPVTGELYFSAKEMGAFKVKVDLENFDVETLISKGKKLISNSGYFPNKTSKFNKFSKSTSLQNTMIIEDNSSCDFIKNEKLHKKSHSFS